MGGSMETGSRALRQRASATMALGEALEDPAAGRGICPHALAAQFQQVMGAALGQGMPRGDVTQPVPSSAAKRTSGMRITAVDLAAALWTVQSMDLVG